MLINKFFSCIIPFKMKSTIPVYLDPDKSIEKRTSDLLSRMTLDEKIAQLQSHWGFELMGPGGIDKKRMNKLLKHGVGHISRIAGMALLPPFIVALITNAIQRHLKQHTRLGIPAIIHEECLAGLQAREATSFPQIIGLASTWDPSLAERMTEIIRTQMRAIGVHQGLSPVLDIARDPRWGRTEETYGEDPYLVARMGTSYVRGLQGSSLKQGIIATAKHFIGYSASEGGLNWAPPHINSKELYEVFARPFEAAIREADLRSVMNAYNEMNGIPCALSYEILTNLLRNKLGFKGFAVSDYMAVSTAHTYHHVTKNLTEAAIRALKAGLDIELPFVEAYTAKLKDAVESAALPEDILDAAVTRVLKAKFELGLFEERFVNKLKIKSAYSNSKNQKLSLEIAQKSIVLLKNQDNILPLSKDIPSIAVIGPNADSIRKLLGDYSYISQIEGVLVFMLNPDNMMTAEINEKVFKEILEAKDEEEAAKKFYKRKTVYEAIKDKVRKETRVGYAKGCNILDNSEQGFKEAVELARASDVVVLVLGDRCGLKLNCTCGEGRDRTDLSLPGVQEKLLREIAAVGKPVILVLVNGRPVSLKWASMHIHAIVEAWVPGEQGGQAIADILFGDCTPGGKLPITFPKNAGQIPVYYYHKPSGGRSNLHGDYVDETAKPLYEFGYGLSYTDFTYSDLAITPASVDLRGQVTLTMRICNSGNREGDEVVQLYVHDREASVTRPVKELAGFCRVCLDPGKTCSITFTINPSQLGFLNQHDEFIVEPGTIDVMIGSSSNDIRLQGEFKMTGDSLKITERKTFFSDVKVKYD
jgi:beta-glucosidase